MSEWMRELLSQKIEESARKRYEMLETLAVAYLEEKGLKASECELVERHEGSKIVWYFRKKGSSE